MVNITPLEGKDHGLKQVEGFRAGSPPPFSAGTQRQLHQQDGGRNALGAVERAPRTMWDPWGQHPGNDTRRCCRASWLPVRPSLRATWGGRAPQSQNETPQKDEPFPPGPRAQRPSPKGASRACLALHELPHEAKAPGPSVAAPAPQGPYGLHAGGAEPPQPKAQKGPSRLVSGPRHQD